MEEQQVAGDVAEAVLDSSVEEGAAGQVAAEMAADHQEIAEMDQGVGEGMVAADQLEGVKDDIGQTIEQGEGLDQVSAEGYRRAVQAIATQVGYDAKSVYALYATENFHSSSSRMANTRFAFEGVGEFLKNLWERIKAAIKSVIEKVKAFYAKHVSSMGRSIKALESMKAKITQNKGKIVGPRFKAPAALKSAFPTSTTLKASDLDTYVSRHQAQTALIKGKKFDSFNEILNTATSMIAGTITEAKYPDTAVDALKKEEGTPDAPYVGGVWLKWDQTNGVDSDLSMTVEKVDLKSDADTEMSVATKQEMTKLVGDAIKLINDTKTFDKAVKAFAEQFNRGSSELDKKFNAHETRAKAAKEGSAGADNAGENIEVMKKMLRLVSRSGSILPRTATEMTQLNVKLGFAVVSYCKFNLAQYK